MKFSTSTLIVATTLVAPLALAANGGNTVPAGFERGCCVSPTNDIGDFNDFGSTAVVDDHGVGFNIAGFNAPRCLEGNTPEPGFTCYTPLEICQVLVPKNHAHPTTGLPDPLPKRTDYFLCDDDKNANSNGLHCCGPDAADPLETRIVGDMPWTCQATIGGPVVGPGGYMCGELFACKEGIACGDPHFQTWSQDWFDFHGECDMVFMKEPKFGKGLGLNIHLRSKARYEYSYIETAAIKIGDDVLEVSSWGDYIFNGVSKAEMPNKFAEQYEVKYVHADKKKHSFEIDLGNGEVIKVGSFKDMVSVQVTNATDYTFRHSQGLMGDFATGNKIGRDGKTIFVEANEFGNEWQVNADEPMLFETARAPQFPNKCVMPTKSASAERRRLGETVALGVAQAACDAVDAVHVENCVYDVMATGDIEIAHAGAF